MMKTKRARRSSVSCSRARARARGFTRDARSRRARGLARCVAAVGASVAPRVASRARARRREWFDCVRARASAVVTYSSLACVVKRRMRARGRRPRPARSVFTITWRKTRLDHDLAKSLEAKGSPLQPLQATTKGYGAKSARVDHRRRRRVNGREFREERRREDARTDRCGRRRARARRRARIRERRRRLERARREPERRRRDAREGFLRDVRGRDRARAEPRARARGPRARALAGDGRRCDRQCRRTETQCRPHHLSTLHASF